MKYKTPHKLFLRQILKKQLTPFFLCVFEIESFDKRKITKYLVSS